MSERLKQLRDLIESAPGKPAEYARWHAMIEAEIAEREAPPPVLEGALAEVVQQLNLATGLVGMLRPDARERFRGVVEAIEAARARLEALALRGARPATRAEWALVAADLAQDEGVVSEDLARVVAGLLPALVEHESVAKAAASLAGPWRLGEESVWSRATLVGDDAAHAAEDGVAPAYPAHWRIASMPRWTFTRTPTLRDAMLAADEALRAEGRILLGGLPAEVALEGAEVAATVDEDGRLVPEDDGEPEVEMRPEVETFGDVVRRVAEAAHRSPAPLRHDWPEPGAAGVCRRCGLERRGGGSGGFTYLRHYGTHGTRGRTAGECRAPQTRSVACLVCAGEHWIPGSGGEGCPACTTIWHPARQHRALEEHLARRRAAGDLSEPEEDAILDAMDRVWWRLTPDERREVDARRWTTELRPGGPFGP